MLLDDSEVHLKVDDIVVQRVTNHAWSNRGTESCFIAFVLIDGVAKAEGLVSRQGGRADSCGPFPERRLGFRNW